MRMNVSLSEQQNRIPVSLRDNTEFIGSVLGELTVVEDYNLLSNKPQIEDVELVGNLPLSTWGFGDLAFADSASAAYTPEGTISPPVFEGEPARITVTGAPVGIVSTPEISVNVETEAINSVDSVGTLPSCTLPVASFTVEGEALRIGWTAGAFSAGTLPTTHAVTAATDVSATASQPVFTGIGSSTFGGYYTPKGTVSAPTFTGTAARIEVTPDE